MEKSTLSEICDTIRGLLGRADLDPLSRCLADQMTIVLNSLEGWENLSGLLATR